MKVAVLFSGGKDSTYAAYLAKQAGHELRYLVTFASESRESYMFHTSNIDLTDLQAQRMGVEHILVRTKGEKEKELDDIESTLDVLDIDGVVSGAVASEYQRSRVDNICRKLKLKSIAPLWHRAPSTLLREQIGLCFYTLITSVSAEGFDESWLGRQIDEQCIRDLEALNKKRGIHVSGEGGEYCSTVLYCPLFSKPIAVKKARKVWLGDRGTYEIHEAV